MLQTPFSGFSNKFQTSLFEIYLVLGIFIPFRVKWNENFWNDVWHPHFHFKKPKHVSDKNEKSLHCFKSFPVAEISISFQRNKTIWHPTLSLDIYTPDLGSANPDLGMPNPDVGSTWGMLTLDMLFLILSVSLSMCVWCSEEEAADWKTSFWSADY